MYSGLERSENIVDLNSLSQKPKLPFIYLQELDLYVLIDSGATNSVINYNPAFEKFSDYWFSEKFTVTGLKKTVSSEDNIMIPLLYELGIFENVHLHVIDWHDRFDALIGSDDLNRLGAKIDYKSCILEIGNIKIPFYFEYQNTKIKPKKVFSNNYVSIPVTIEKGEVIFPEYRLTENIIIPESIANANNGVCHFPCDQQFEINFHERVHVTPLNDHFEVFEPPRIKENFNIANLIRTSHMNQEERNVVIPLCKNYSRHFL